MKRVFFVIIIIASNFTLVAQKVQKVSFENLDLEFKIPESWLTKEVSDDIFAYSENCSSTVAFCANMVVRVVPNVPGKDINDAAMSIKASIESKYNQSKFMGLGQLDEGSIRFAIMDFLVVENATVLGATFAFYIVENNILIVNYMAENDKSGSYAKKRVEFIGSIKTFEMKD